MEGSTSSTFARRDATREKVIKTVSSTRDATPPRPGWTLRRRAAHRSEPPQMSTARRLHRLRVVHDVLEVFLGQRGRALRP